MPLFEYKCAACGNQFELLIRVGSGAPSCPSCASSSVERLLSLFAVSSEGSRQIGLNALRKRNAGNRKDFDMAEVERIKHHEDDHN